MKPKPALTPGAEERLRELYHKCSTGLLLLPPELFDDEPAIHRSARPRRAEAPTPAPSQTPATKLDPHET